MSSFKVITRSVLAACVALSLLAGVGLSGVAIAGPVNINTADAATIARELKGIGVKRAQSIVDYRVKHGAFKSADELRLVKGIGAKAIEKNRSDIRTDGRTDGAKAAAPQKPRTSAAELPARQ